MLQLSVTLYTRTTTFYFNKVFEVEITRSSKFKLEVQIGTPEVARQFKFNVECTETMGRLFK
jgi:hypothetical protein